MVLQLKLRGADELQLILSLLLHLLRCVIAAAPVASSTQRGQAGAACLDAVGYQLRAYPSPLWRAWSAPSMRS